MNKMWSILLAFLLSTYYVGLRFFQWLKMLFPHLHGWVYTLICALCASSIVLSFMPLPSIFKTIVRWMSAYLMGIMVYLLLFFLIADLLIFLASLVKIIPKPIPQHVRFYAGLAVVLVTVGVVSYGLYNARQIQHVSYVVQIKKSMPEDVNLVLISDLHLGAVGSEERLEGIVKRINQLKPDLVCIAGDIFNDDFYAIRNPERVMNLFRQIQAKYGVYASLGNHDSGKTFHQMIDLLKRSNIQLLNDEYVIIDQRLVLFGRVDPSPIGGFDGLERQEISESLSTIDSRLPIIVMDHRPPRLEEYQGKVDLILSGHTHKGQIFPGNLITNAIYEVDYGYYQRNANSPYVIVTSGAGTWGLPMRVGTQNEIVSIRLIGKR